MNMLRRLNKEIFIRQSDFRKINKLNLPKLDFVFFDPPYKSCFYIDFLLIVKNSNLFHEKTTIFIETSTEIDFQNINLKVVFSRKISSSFLYCLKLN